MPDPSRLNYLKEQALRTRLMFLEFAVARFLQDGDRDRLARAYSNEWELPELSDDARPYRQAAEDWYMAHDLEVLGTEVTMFHPLYAGTADFIARVDGRLTIGDFKTSKAIYPEAALQLSALFGCGVDKHSDPLPWRDADGEFTEVPDLLVVRIGEDGFEEKTVADPFNSLRTFLSLLTAWNWKHEQPYA